MQSHISSYKYVKTKSLNNISELITYIKILTNFSKKIIFGALNHLQYIKTCLPVYFILTYNVVNINLLQ